MKEVKINLTVTEQLSLRLKKIAQSKGMKFHAYLAQELDKVATREEKKL